MSSLREAKQLKSINSSITFNPCVLIVISLKAIHHFSISNDLLTVNIEDEQVFKCQKSVTAIKPLRKIVCKELHAIS